MDYVKDGGLSLVRYLMERRNDALEDRVLAAMTSTGKAVGHLTTCQCGAKDHWTITASTNPAAVLVSCGCNGSSFPVQIGRPVGMGVFYRRSLSDLGCPDHKCRHAVVFGIGYPDRVPELGTLDVERAQELLIAMRCIDCSNEGIWWSQRLPAPPPIEPWEGWLRDIQGVRPRKR